MPPAARITDMHTCPMISPGPVPHVGGPLSSGATSVLVGAQPAARVSDSLVCVGPVDMVAAGESSVLIEGMPAARLGDSTAHGGIIVAGCPTVLIGKTAQAVTLGAAAVNGTPFCEECEKARHTDQAVHAA